MMLLVNILLIVALYFSAMVAYIKEPVAIATKSETILYLNNTYIQERKRAVKSLFFMLIGIVFFLITLMVYTFIQLNKI